MLSWKLNKITHSPVNTRIFINGNYICAEALASLSDYDILRQSQNTLAPYTCKCHWKNCSQVDHYSASFDNLEVSLVSYRKKEILV